MAHLQYGNGGVKFDTVLSQIGTFTSITPTQVVITTTEGWKIIGSGSFNLSSTGAVTGGTITGYASYKPDGSLYASTTNMSMSVSTYLAYANTGNITGLYNAILGGNDIVSGGTGNDSFQSSTGNDSYDGGTGIDTIVYNGFRTSYTITPSAGSAALTVSKPGTSATDILTNTERLQFGDNKAVAFDIEGAAGQAYRLYQAAFDRKPDAGGLGYWISLLDKGASLADAAGGFMNSAEFKNLYGAAPSNADLVTRLYQNVLHRAPDDGGFKYWTGLLDSHQLTPMNVMTGFSESPENKAAVIGAISNGMEYNLWLG
jgi:Ca2+-binding RTX toxin-like protein